MRIRDLGIFLTLDPRYEKEKFRSGIRYKHPGSGKLLNSDIDLSFDSEIIFLIFTCPDVPDSDRLVEGARHHQVGLRVEVAAEGVVGVAL
jgi:hypothetical protein